ncbi:TPA: conserved hypothetical protein [Aquificae Conch Spring virus]|nr:TPA: conserved hypothetical protein [Aquificae Conch Spring virus]
MGLTDILHDLRVKFFGYNENDVYNFLAYPKKSELNKLLRDKKSREQFFSTVERIAQKKGLDSVKTLEAVSRYILQKAKDNGLFTSEIITAPRLQDYEMIIGIDELGRYAFGEKDLGMGFVRVLEALDVGKRMKKKDRDKFVTNVRNTLFIAYQVDKTIERIEKALDTASDLSLVLGLGGLATKGALWLGRRVLKNVTKDILTRSMLVRVANNVASFGIVAGDIAFAGSELGKATLNTVAKGLPLTYSLDHLILSGISLAGFLGAKTKRVQEAIQKIEGVPHTTVDDVRRKIIENQLPIPGYDLNLTTDEASKMFVSQIRKYLESKAGKKLSLENLESMNVLMARLLGSFAEQWKVNTLLVSDAFVNPHKYTHKIHEVYETVKNFIITNKEDFLALIDKLPEERFAFVASKPELFEFFYMNTSKVFLDRIRFLLKEIKENEIIDKRKLYIRLKETDIEVRAEEAYMWDFENLINYYVWNTIKNGKLSVGVEFVLKESDNVEKVLREYYLPTIYIPTSDYRKILVVSIKEGDEEKEILVDVPAVLVGALGEKFKGDLTQIHLFLRRYVAEVKGLDLKQVKNILVIYDPVSQLFPSTVIRKLGLNKLRILDDWLNIFPDEELKEIGLRKDKATKLLEFGKNISEAFNQFSIRQQRIQAENMLKEIRAILKELLGYDPKDKVRTETLIKEALKEAQTSDNPALQDAVYVLSEQVKRLKPLVKDLKAKFTDPKKASLAEKLIQNFQRVETIIEKLSKNPIEEVRKKVIDLIYQEKDPRFLRKYGSGFVDVKMLYELDPELAFDYLARAYTRPWTSDKRWLLSFVRRTEERLFTDPFLKDTDFVKTLELIRDYQGRETARSKWLQVIGTLSKIYTWMLPRVAIGAGIQLFNTISQRYPSFRFFQAPFETIKDIITTPELRRFLYSQIKEELHEDNYLSFWVRAIEPFIQTIFYNELLKNPQFRKEVLQDFGHIVKGEFTPVDAKLLAEHLTNLINSPAAISPFMGTTLGILAYIQSWFPYVVAPFQIAVHSLAKSLTSSKHAMNFFKHLLIGSTILPATVTQFSGVTDTIKQAYEGLSVIYHTMASIITGDPEPIQSYLEEQEPVLASIWKSLFSNLTNIPRDELTGRLFHDLGLLLALHGDEVAWQYVRAGLDFLARHLDLANKNLFSPGSVSTSFEVTVPIINTALKIINNLTVYEKEQPQLAGKTLLETIMQTMPIAKNIRAGILHELTQYGRINEDSVLRYFDDEYLTTATGLSYFLGVMLKHTVTTAKIFDTLFLGGLGEAVARVFTGEERKMLFLPKVTDAKSYRLKILGNEEYVLRSLKQIEDPHTKKNVLLRFANIMDNYFDEKKIKKTDRTPEEEINMFKSYLTFLTYDPSILDDTELDYMIQVANKSAYYFKLKYGLDEKDLHHFLAKALDELKIRRKLRGQLLPPETESQGS